MCSLIGSDAYVLVQIWHITGVALEYRALLMEYRALLTEYGSL